MNIEFRIFNCVGANIASDDSDGKHYADVDAAIAADHMTPAAADRDLAACWIGAFDSAGVKKTLGLPDGVEPIALLPIGYSNPSGRPKPRKDIKDLVR